MLSFEVPVNPADLSVNIRYFTQQTVPPSVRKEMDKVRDAAIQASKDAGWVLGATDYLAIRFIYYFENWRPDLDNPIKRSLDALSEGLEFNDNRVVDLCVTRRISPTDPRMGIEITEVPLSDVPSPIGMKRKSADPVWVGGMP